MRGLKIGLALGAGATQGRSYTGVINAPRRTDIEIDIVAGRSIGSLVRAAYACNRLPVFESWICSFSNWDVLRLMDLPWQREGLLHGEKVFDHYRRITPVTDIKRCERRPAVAATNLSTGRELWFTEGDLYLAVQASCSIPELVVSVRHNGYWLVDDAVVSPVPVSLTRAMGADTAIAAGLQHDARPMQQDLFSLRTPRPEAGEKEGPRYTRLRARLTQMSFRRTTVTPTMMETMTTSIQVLGNHLKRNCMVGDPSDILLQPYCPQMSTLDFYRVGEAVATGQLAVERKIDKLLPLVCTVV